MLIVKQLGYKIDGLKHAVSDNYSTNVLRIMIILWAIFLVLLVLHVNNKWVLAGILLYEVLP